MVLLYTYLINIKIHQRLYKKQIFTNQHLPPMDFHNYRSVLRIHLKLRPSIPDLVSKDHAILKGDSRKAFL